MQTQLLTAGMLAQGLSHTSSLAAGNSLLQREENEKKNVQAAERSQGKENIKIITGSNLKSGIKPTKKFLLQRSKEMKSPVLENTQPLRIMRAVYLTAASIAQNAIRGPDKHDVKDVRRLFSRSAAPEPR